MRLLVRSDAPGHLRWLREFLTPHFTEVETGPFVCHVELREDTKAFAALHDAGPLHGEAGLDCYALDSSVIRLPLWTAPLPTVFDEQFRVFCSVDAAGRRVVMLTLADNFRVRTPLMRVVRELAMNDSQRRGALFLHAAAVALGDQGLIIAGEKAAGKTTTLIHLLSHPAARYISNDRVRVALDGEAAELVGMPSVVTIRPRTRELFPVLQSRLQASGYHLRLTLDEAVRRPLGPPQPWGDGRIGLSPAQFCALLKVRPQRSARLAALLFPQVTGLPGSVHFERLAPCAAARRLHGALFGAGSWKKTSDLFTLGHEPAAPDDVILTRQAEQLTAMVPAFVCHLGLDAYTTDRLAVELLRHVAK